MDRSVDCGSGVLGFLWCETRKVNRNLIDSLEQRLRIQGVRCIEIRDIEDLGWIERRKYGGRIASRAAIGRSEMTTAKTDRFSAKK
jgi:hypothetical protein